MAIFRCQRQVHRVGGSTYVPFPKQAMLDLRLFVKDWVEFELDTETHQVTIRPVHWRAVAPTLHPHVNGRDMLPQYPSDPPEQPRGDPRQGRLVEAGK